MVAGGGVAGKSEVGTTGRRWGKRGLWRIQKGATLKLNEDLGLRRYGVLRRPGEFFAASFGGDRAGIR